MSDSIYDDVIGTESEGRQTERMEMTVDIYESAERDHDFRTETNTHQPLQRSESQIAEDYREETHIASIISMTKRTKMSQPVNGNINTDGTQDLDRGTQRNHTGSDCVKTRSSRAAPVCLVLLCVLLLTAVIVLCVHIHTKSTNYTEERDQLLNIIKNQTEETQQILNIITNLTEERDQLLNKDITLANESDGVTKNNYQTNERGEFNQERNELWKMLSEMDGCVYQSSFYYMSSEEKSWSGSRRYCTERGADLIIINNKEKEELVKKMSGSTGVWMGLTDSDVEGRWTWVDGSTLTSGSWMFGEPNGYEKENCAVLFPSGWYDYPCENAFKCICVKNIKKI